MADINCSACSSLNEHASEFVVNGVTDAVCTSLKNNTGFNASAGVDDCEDLDLANDCLIGNMADEIEAYDVCDWKEYMKKFVPNVWNVLKAIICAICGLWTNITNLWTKVNCISQNLDTNDAPRIWVDKADVVWGTGFHVKDNDMKEMTGIAVSYCNTHAYVQFQVTNAMRTALQAEEVYETPKLVFQGTSTWTAPYYIVRQEEQVGITSGGFFTFMATHTNNGNGTHTVSVYLRSRLRDLNGSTPLSSDGIIVNMPTNIKLLGATAC